MTGFLVGAACGLTAVLSAHGIGFLFGYEVGFLSGYFAGALAVTVCASILLITNG